MNPLNWLKSLASPKTPKNAKRIYDGAKYQGHVWGGPTAFASASADVDLAASREILRRRSRHAYQNGASARAIVEGLVALVVSTGIDVVPDSGDEENDLALREQWMYLIECVDASGRCDLWELQRQAMRSQVLSGEFLWQIVNIDDASRPFPFAIMALEADQLSDIPVEKCDESAPGILLRRGCIVPPSMPQPAARTFETRLIWP